MQIEVAVEITKSIDHLYQVIEHVCHYGCSAVREIIEKLERNEFVPELALYNHSDQHIILAELKAIMNVYSSIPQQD